MTDIQPELWVDTPGDALEFYEAAFGAKVLHQVGEGDDIVAQLAVGEAVFWVSRPSPARTPPSRGYAPGSAGRILLGVEAPDDVVRQAVAAGATESSPAGDEHGWRVGRVVDPFGPGGGIGKPLVLLPPS